jgi:acyl-coenzyme A synthetase/AMP-(fatty) acid ligase
LLTLDEQRYVARDCEAAAVVLDAAVFEDGSAVRHERPDRTWVLSRHGVEEARDLDAELRQAKPVAPAKIASDEIAVLQYTSGSTGQPKGVVHLHGGLLAAPACFGARLELTAADRVLSTAKLPFGYGFGNSVLFPLAAGASVVLHPGPPEVHAIADLLRRHRPTVLCAVPAFYAAVLRLPDARDRLDLSSVRLLVSAGEHLPAALAESWADAFGTEILNGLGATECLHIFLATIPGTSTRGTSGRPVPHCDVRVVDDAGRDLPAGEAGRLLVRSPMNGAGYWGGPRNGDDTFTAGWVQTGDVVVERPDGEWQHLGRGDDMINAGGFKLAPQEIEAEIARHPEVAECAVVGRRDGDYALEQIVAFVVPRDGAGDAHELERALRRHLRTVLPPPRRPAAIVVIGELPRTSTGKVTRYRLRELGAA